MSSANTWEASLDRQTEMKTSFSISINTVCKSGRPGRKTPVLKAETLERWNLYNYHGPSHRMWSSCEGNVRWLRNHRGISLFPMIITILDVASSDRNSSTGGPDWVCVEENSTHRRVIEMYHLHDPPLERPPLRVSFVGMICPQNSLTFCKHWTRIILVTQAYIGELWSSFKTTHVAP